MQMRGAVSPLRDMKSAGQSDIGGSVVFCCLLVLLRGILGMSAAGCTRALVITVFTAPELVSGRAADVSVLVQGREF